MRSAVKISSGLLLAFGLVAGALAQQYAAKITVNGGNSFVVKQLNIKGDRLYPDSGTSSTALSMVKEIEFRFSGLSLSMCESMFRTGDRKSLEGLLGQYVEPVAQYSYLPTNLGEYLVWMLRAQYWNRNEAGASKTIGQIRKMNDSEKTDIASLYFVMLLLDQGKVSDAKIIFTSVAAPENFSVPMAEYIRGKFALEEGDPRQAMQHVARIIAFHSRDPEWMAPATVLEARIYQHLGQPQKAEIVANELIIAYPGTQWSKLGQQIKKEATGKLGG
jgi:tetratricopeptide (TPR) repeat protein